MLETVLLVIVCTVITLLISFWVLYGIYAIKGKKDAFDDAGGKVMLVFFALVALLFICGILFVLGLIWYYFCGGVFVIGGDELFDMQASGFEWVAWLITSGFLLLFFIMFVTALL